MMKHASLLYFLAAVFLCLPIFGQQIISTPMPFLDRLSSNEIMALHQDKQGFIWIGTPNGVVRYDGYDTQEFKNNYKSPNLLVDNDILCFTDDDQWLWVGTGKGISLIDKTTYQSIPFPDHRVADTRIKDLRTDRKGSIWIVTDNALHKCSSPRKVDKSYTLKNSPTTLYEDHSGYIWALTWNGGVYRYDSKLDTFIQYAEFGSNNAYRMLQDKDNQYWILTWGSGIWHFVPHAKKADMFKQQSIKNPVRNFPEQIFYDMVQDDQYGYFWALSHFRLYVLKQNSKGQLEEVPVETLAEHEYNRIDLSKNYSRIIKDFTGNLWIGAFDIGHIISFPKEKIENHTLDGIKENIGLDPNIICLNRDSKGIIWLEQARYGLCLYDEENHQMSFNLSENRLYSIDVGFIVPSRQEETLWIGSRGTDSWIYKMKQDHMRISILSSIDLSTVSPTPGEIRQMVEDRYGNLWIGTNQSLFIKQSDTDKITRAPFEQTGITDIAEDAKGRIWISSRKGLYQAEAKLKPQLEKYYSKEVGLKPGEYIKKICADPQGNIWMATSEERLLKLDTTAETTTDQTEICGLKGDAITRILCQGNQLWVLHNKYIIGHNLQQGDNQIYSVNDNNIDLSSFRYGAGFVDANGNLYASGHGGFVKIRTTASEKAPSMPNRPGKAIITDVKTDNHSLIFTPENSRNNNSLHEVTFPSDARNIEVTFSVSTYDNRKNMRYAYKLSKADKEWTYLDNGRHTAFYNHLSKGKHILTVKVVDTFSNQEGEATTIILNKLPAIYETWYAYLIYTLIPLIILAAIFCSYSRRLKRKHKATLQEEMTQFKLNYFTNISHELLTPLSIISCVADELRENHAGTEKETGILYTNVNRLKRLLQQVLDFRKMDSGKMKLNIEQRDISSFISGIAGTNFQPLARKKHIDLKTNISNDVWGYLDFDKLDKILFNLLSNALKYTPEHKKVFLTMSVSEEKENRLLCVEVKDEGIGIPEKNLKHIFTRFYNSKKRIKSESNGIGLSLTKEMIALHHGTIGVSSEVDKGSVFTVKLPIDREAYSHEEIYEPSEATCQEVGTETDSAGTDKEKPLVLFIDDNEHLRELVQSILRNKYSILTAADGEQGLELLEDNAVDIIVCDMMMPKMNGLELCRRVKGEVQTSHIPIIMLTVKSSTEDQIECYKAGAESFISKPFDTLLLQARIDNLLEARESRQHSFQTKMEVNISEMDYQTVDKIFLDDAIACVEKRLQETDFDIVQMATELHVSRSTLNRKIKAITGLTPLDFIRNVRLKHACTLLKEPSISISEVAYTTGFSTPRYFAKCFKDEFQMTPSQYQSGKEDTSPDSL